MTHDEMVWELYRGFTIAEFHNCQFDTDTTADHERRAEEYHAMAETFATAFDRLSGLTMDTLKQTQDSVFQPSEAVGIRMAVIEYRTIGGHEWKICLIEYNAYDTTEKWLSEKCTELSRRYTEAEWRFRHGTLKLDPSDECEIFKSE